MLVWSALATGNMIVAQFQLPHPYPIPGQHQQPSSSPAVVGDDESSYSYWGSLWKNQGGGLLLAAGLCLILLIIAFCFCLFYCDELFKQRARKQREELSVAERGRARNAVVQGKHAMFLVFAHVTYCWIVSAESDAKVKVAEEEQVLGNSSTAAKEEQHQD